MQLRLSVPTPDPSAAQAVELGLKHTQEWIRGLPGGDAMETVQTVHDRIAALNRQVLDPAQRLTLLELYRQSALKLLPSIEERFAGTPLPHREDSRTAADLARELLTELANGYKLSLLDMLAAAPAGEHSTLAAQRALASMGAILTVSYRTYAAAPAGIWLEMHELYRYAARSDLQDEPVADNGGPPGSIGSTYKAALLLALADPYRMMPGEVDEAAKYLSRFAGAAHVRPATRRPAAAGIYPIPTDTDAPPRALADNAKAPRDSSGLVLDTLDFTRQLQQKVARLEAGESCQTLELPEDTGSTPQIGLLRRVLQHLSGAPKRNFSRFRTEAETSICTGIGTVHHFLGQSPSRPGSESGDAQPTPISRLDAHRWTAVNESAGGLGLTGNSRDADGVRVGEVIGLRQEKAEEWNIGVVRWVRANSEHELDMGVQVLAANAMPVAVKPALGGDAGGFSPALMLAGSHGSSQSSTLLAPCGLFGDLAELELLQDGATRLIQATRLVDRTADYDMFQFRSSRPARTLPPPRPGRIEGIELAKTAAPAPPAPKKIASMIGNSPAFLETMRLIEKIADCDAPVLIEGETGTGKELAARAIHYLGTRRDMPFIPVNCGAIPDTLIENELFGHHKGAFTDARESARGLISQAHNGTLFLDEIDALSPKGQVTLLRFLQDQQFRPLGSKQEESANVRIIAATNSDILKLVETGAFRPDLLFRLKILGLEIPPLRDRQGDAELLATHYLQQYSAKYKKPLKRLDRDTAKWLDSYDWPGNIRELENLIHREFLLADGPTIHIRRQKKEAERRKGLDRRDYMPPDTSFTKAKAKVIADFEKKFLARTLADAKGNVTLAAKIAGKERRAFGKLLKKYGIDKSPFGSGKKG